MNALLDVPLTAAEKMEGLIEAVVLVQVKERNSTTSLLQGSESAAVDAEIDAEILARDAVIERLHTLMAEGLLDRCLAILRAETAGRP